MTDTKHGEADRRGYILVFAVIVLALGVIAFVSGRAISEENGSFIDSPVADAELPASLGEPSRSGLAPPHIPDGGVPSVRSPHRAGPGLDETPIEYWPRDEREWQGMLVDMTRRTLCGSTDHCSFGLVCDSGEKCGPCTTDQECLEGESCVLDHCVPTANVRCRTQADCEGLCILTGYTRGDRRGTSDTLARCQEALPNREQNEDDLSAGDTGQIQVHPTVSSRGLLESLRASRRAEGTR